VAPTSTRTPHGGSPTATATGAGGNGGTGGPGSGGPSTPSSTGPAGGGGGGGNGGAPGGPTGPETPRIPTGHPATGRDVAASSAAAVWLLMGLLSLAAAAGAGFLGWKVPAPRARRRH
jgi:hypothetical protein